jgi:hypothetical protein
VRCWEKDPDRRPSFAEIATMLSAGRFAIVSHVDIDEVTQYVGRVEEFDIRRSARRASDRIGCVR